MGGSAGVAAAFAILIVLPLLAPIALCALFLRRWRMRLGTLRDGRFALRFERRR